jgi:putative transposase
MPRASRYLENGFIYHLTHRCRDGAFHLRFKEERNAYREWLRIGVNRYRVPVLAYAITSNHIHIVAEVRDKHRVADMMRLAAGATAQAWNRRKGHAGAVWEHPYRCTRIQDGHHLFNCLCYVDLNMVRAGRVAHPRDWRWCGYDELMGARQRYRLVDRAALVRLTDTGSMSRFVRQYRQSVEDRIAAGTAPREPWWTEAVAVGDSDFVAIAAGSTRSRTRLETYPVSTEGDHQAWAIRESRCSYNADSVKETYL